MTIRTKSYITILIKEDIKNILPKEYNIPLESLTRKREIDGLVEAMRYFNLSESYLVTSEEDQIIEIENKRIFVIPLFKWLLEIF